jgi:pyridoxamine 5'-phosphate oxidase
MDEADVGLDPLAALRTWYDDARSAGETEPEAMALATVGSDGVPSVRMVLLKALDDRGLTFYTNYHSRKAGELEASGLAAVTFRWPLLDRQARVVGRAERVAALESDAYFASRSRLSQMGAWASAQSQPIASRADLERSLSTVEERFAGSEVPRPEWWGGILIRPFEVELWQGRSGRLHDRLQYRKDATGGWTRVRLAP